MELGAFSVRLAVKNLDASRQFYAKLGFTQFGGDASQNWLILKNGDHIIGRFQGMLEKNSLPSIQAGTRTLTGSRLSIAQTQCDEKRF
jgi:hypothetical protein